MEQLKPARHLRYPSDQSLKKPESALSREELQGISQKSCGVLSNLGPQIQWVESYVIDDRVYSVYIAASEELIREHAWQGGFPANRISKVRAIIDPTTAESLPQML